ncbi:hypothetical protein D3C77_377230 [compost metagenome]
MKRIPFLAPAHSDVHVVFAILIAYFLEYPPLNLTIQLLLIFDKAEEYTVHQTAKHPPLLQVLHFTQPIHHDILHAPSPPSEASDRSSLLFIVFDEPDPVSSVSVREPAVP